MAEEETKGSPEVPKTRTIDGVEYPIRVVSARNNQHGIGVSRKPLKWTAGTEISSYNQKGRSGKPLKP